MGLKDWFAGKVAGPQGYGDAMGRRAWEHGSALVNMVFLSHGTGPHGAPTTIFDTAADMQAAGVKPRFSEITELVLDSLTTDE